MPMYNTGNPVGSTAPKDLYDNAQVLDKLVVGTDPMVEDRLGNQRYSWAGMEYDFRTAQDGRTAEFEEFLAASAFIFIGDYGPGLNFTNRSQYMIRDGVPYRLAPSATLPYTTTGNWATEQVNFTPVSADQVLRQDLASADAGKGASLVAFSSYQTVQEALGKALFFNHPSQYGYAPGDDIADLLNSNQAPFDLLGDAYQVSTGVTRTGHLRNGSLTYAGGGSVGTFLNGILVFTGTVNLDASRMHVKYTGSSAGVRGICAHSGTHQINLRGCFAEETTEQGIRVQGCNSPDLTGCETLNCMKDSVGSSDFNLAYGAIAIFGGTSVCNKAIVKNCNVRGSSTGISIMYGYGHVVRDNELTCTDKNASPALSMGVYSGGLLTNLEVAHNRVTNYPLEGIDVHNTGGSQVDGITAIWIHHNHVRGSGYLGISVISGTTFNIRDASIHDNTVEVDAATAPLGYGGAIAAERVTTLMLARNRCFMAGTPAVPTSSFGVQVTTCEHVVSSDNYFRGNWGIYEGHNDWNSLKLEGVHGEPLPAGAEGIRLTQPATRPSAVGQLRNCRVVGVAAGSKVIRQVGAQPLTIFTMQDNYLNGAVDMVAGISDGLVTDNLMRNFSGTLALVGTAVAYNNPGWLGFVAASASPVPGPIKAWGTYRQGGQTYQFPLYQPTTL